MTLSHQRRCGPVYVPQKDQFAGTHSHSLPLEQGTFSSVLSPSSQTSTPSSYANRPPQKNIPSQTSKCTRISLPQTVVSWDASALFVTCRNPSPIQGPGALLRREASRAPPSLLYTHTASPPQPTPAHYLSSLYFIVKEKEAWRKQVLAYGHMALLTCGV